MSFYGLIFRLVGWAIGLGLITGRVTYYNDGHTDGLMVVVGWGILLWWAAVTMPNIMAFVGAAHGPVNAAERPASTTVDMPLQTSVTMVACSSCKASGTAERVVSDRDQALALRGYYDGRTLVRCLRCDSGFSLSTDLARPMIVSPERWRAMDAKWRTSFPNLAKSEDVIFERHRTRASERSD